MEQVVQPLIARLKEHHIDTLLHILGLDRVVYTSAGDTLVAHFVENPEDIYLIN
jgi:uncharacterized hydantoinase/oxoprolinase family protein